MKQYFINTAMVFIIITMAQACRKENTLSKMQEDNAATMQVIKKDTPYVASKLIDTPYRATAKGIDTLYKTMRIIDTPYLTTRIVIDTPYKKP